MSTLFNLNVVHKQKPEPPPHPWANIIKDKYSNDLKYVHNSVRNPHYPIKEKKRKLKPPSERFKITVIGNRVTEEFIYCSKMVQGLHRYKSRIFDAPVIRGVSTIEWPTVWNDLKIEYGGLAYCLLSQVMVLVNGRVLGGEKELKEFIDRRYVYHPTLDYPTIAVENFVNFVNSSGRPCVYMHISVDKEEIGTMIFMLYNDIVPLTCDNFLRLAQTRKGGYSGTPIQRIVEDGWIQCGGYGLKSVDLACENFIVPFDRRGVIAMANDGRDKDCSTQFFVILRPLPWMSCKYVAFGQLIDGDSTLKKIEQVPVWYESPKLSIRIDRCGVLKLDCHDIMVNPRAKEYVHSHIENLIALGEWVMELLMHKVYLEIEFRNFEKMELEGETENEKDKQDLRATQRFLRRKEEIENQLAKEAQRPSSAPSKASRRSRPSKSSKQIEKEDNNDFDVENYSFEYEPEEYAYSEATTKSIPAMEEKPYYLPMTDVPYPGEVSSEYNLKKFLLGDYCLESDLEKKERVRGAIPFTEQIKRHADAYRFHMDHNSTDNEEEEESSMELDSDDEEDIKNFLAEYGDQGTFAGTILKKVAQESGKPSGVDKLIENKPITDEQLRLFRFANKIIKRDKHRVVSLASADNENSSKKIKRRQTGYMQPGDLPKASSFIGRDYEGDDRTKGKVRIAPSTVPKSVSATGKRQRVTGYPHHLVAFDSDTAFRPSLLHRMYDSFQLDDDLTPTLKDYRPMSESRQKTLMLTPTRPDDNLREEQAEDVIRHSITVEDSLDQVLNLQFGKTIARKISSDYVKAIEHVEHRPVNSIRSLEYARTRPSMSVSEYQARNLKHKLAKDAQEKVDYPSWRRGLRLPGDTPLYLMCNAIWMSSAEHPLSMSPKNSYLP